MHESRRPFAWMVALACLLVAPRLAVAQCMVANPSFEVLGSSGATFGGWNQFGPTGRVTSDVHGANAARVTGTGTAWGVAGYWQPLPCTAGQRWNVSVCVAHSATSPLLGQSTAIVNLEWRDAGGNLISYECHAVADASTPAGLYRVAGFTSLAAPTGTATVRLVLGVLQGPSDPVPVVTYDLATCVLVGPPSIETLQWGDFGGGRTLSFSGRTWRVKGPGYFGPGPNLFDDSASAVWVDANGRLHLTIRKVGASWYSSEVALEQPLGYGDYVFTTRGRLDLLDRNAVLGLFLWEYGPCYDNSYLWWNPYNEIDVEFSRWGNPANSIGQFVAQPADWGGNLSRFNATFGDTERTSHAFRWRQDRVEFRSWRGGPDDEATGAPIATWTYTGPHIPRPDIPRIHLNLWQLAAPAVGQEVVLDAVTFRPACPGGPCGPLAVPADASTALRLAPAAPNPFGSSTRIRFRIPSAADADLSVYDLAGRRVRRLVSGPLAPGEHVVEWDARDDRGQRVAPGLYLYRFRSAGVSEARRVVVLG